MAPRRAVVAPCQCRSNGGDQADGDGINKRGGQGEQIHRIGVFAVQRRGNALAQTQRILQRALYQRLIQQVQQGHAARTDGNGHADGQQSAHNGASALRGVGAAAVAAPAQQVDQQRDHAQEGARRHAGNGAGRADVLGIPLPQQPPDQHHAHDQLGQGFDNLAQRGGTHIALPLGVAAHGGKHAHEQHRR